jgi:opacity protein-like surface antigen
VSLNMRASFFPDGRLDPFTQIGYGIQSFSMTVEGPGARGSHTGPGLALDLGGGLRYRVGSATSVELLVQYARANTQDNVFSVAGVWVGTGGMAETFAVKAGLTYNLGGRGQ